MPTSRKKKNKIIEHSRPKEVHETIIVNGSSEDPIEKTRLPPEVDWQSLAAKKNRQ